MSNTVYSHIQDFCSPMVTCQILTGLAKPNISIGDALRTGCNSLEVNKVILVTTEHWFYQLYRNKHYHLEVLWVVHQCSQGMTAGNRDLSVYANGL